MGRYTRPAMPAAAFDTLGAARELEAAGIARVQAEAIAQVINHGDERGVSKADLRDAVADLATRADLRDAVAGLATRAELSAIRDAIAGMRWTIGLLAAFMFAIGLRVFGLL